MAKRTKPLFLLNANWRLSYDRLQWIVERRKGKRWRGVSFVASSKRVLIRVIDEHGIDLDEEAKAHLRHLPSSFRQFIEAEQQSSAVQNKVLPWTNAGGLNDAGALANDRATRGRDQSPNRSPKGGSGVAGVSVSTVK